ncbi:MAG: hypothetical protein J6B02_02925 [Selenomonadales bacterium]|nr:hypothetical protein [Selenomonadales bacterium]
MLRIANMRVSIDNKKSLAALAAKKLRIPPQAVLEVVVVRKAVDARRKQNIVFVYTIDVKVTGREQDVLKRAASGDVKIAPINVPFAPVLGKCPLGARPVIVGFGPAGMVAGLILAKYGYRPIILERGACVEERQAAIRRFEETGELDVRTNIQFGEGGAGTFSDGKLTTRVNDSQMKTVLEMFVKAGAPEEILYVNKPHIGTDKLCTMVKNIREEIKQLGGEVRFDAQVTDIHMEDGQVRAVEVNGQETIEASVVLLGIGHSARDTYRMLHARGLAMEPKPFSIGVRIEHPQELIDRAQYGESAGHPALGAADYALVYHDKENGRTAYSFCMCPGGQVVGATSVAGGVVTNGMSVFARNSGIANSALVVNVDPSDCGGGVLDGASFQDEWEKRAFEVGGANYCAPCQTVGDFINGTEETPFLVEPSYRPGVVRAKLTDCLPSFVTDTLRRALPEFGRKIRGFDHEGAVMTGIETRTSAPIRILRTAELQSENALGLYPMGEGAGYAGGIMSAALDGLHTAEKIMAEYRPFR